MSEARSGSVTATPGGLQSGSWTGRTHNCGELRAEDIGREVTLCGWVAKRRDHGGLVFGDLRDRYGVTQVVFDPALPGGAAAHQEAGRLRTEFVIWCKGKVRHRPAGMTNPKLVTGEIEVACTELQILSEAKTPPFAIEEETDVAETTRLKYRYLDLRRPNLQKNLIKRHRMVQAVRNYLDEQQFLEIETPILYKSTPEGARDFVVPSRLNPGEFYALPQSPQTLKQLLMIAGFDRYYQIARCFRDEDLRADRQPEFSQIDMETSFLTEDQFLTIMEGMVKRIWKEVEGIELETPFPRMTYREAMERFGSDKPDLRYGLELSDLSGIFRDSEFRVFSAALTPNSRGRKGAVRALKVEGQAERFSRKDLDDLTAHAAKYGAKGLLWIKVQAGGEMQSPAVKFFTAQEKKDLIGALGLKEGDLVLIVADSSNRVVFDSLGQLRIAVATRMGLVPKHGEGKPNILWVTNFPLLEFDDKEGRYFASHHPFTSPKPEHFDAFVAGKNLDDLEAAAYDLVINGVEIGSGSLRIFRSDVQDAMFKILGLSEEEARERFGFFIEALSYGTPPHCGMALGVDRLVQILCGVNAIREVMAFPKTQKGTCLMSESPSEISPEQMTELHVSVIRPKVEA